jgi:tRNA (Thr-GGU) A37 N-methylase
MNSIYRFRPDNEKIREEARQVIYHRVTSRPNKIILRLVDINNNLIDVNNINLFVELHMKEIS